jgi:hypothetical protein
VLRRASFTDCGGPHDLSSQHTISSWESKQTTCAEEAAILYLTEVPSRHRQKSLLHVGIGNGDLFAALGAELRSYTGLTISRPEIEHFRERFPRAENARTVLANKYDERFFSSFEGKFDIIVDVNLKSFACCERHFRALITHFAKAVSQGGLLVTAQSGLDFGWAGNTAVAYTPGADVSPEVSHRRVLGSEGFARLAGELGLAVRSVSIAAIDQCSPETLWTCKKA